MTGRKYESASWRHSMQVRMLNPIRGKNHGKYRRGEGKITANTAFVQKLGEGETSDKWSWNVKVMILERKKKRLPS